MPWRLKRCQKCRGDLELDGDEWRCWQCGQYYYPMRSEPLDIPPDPPGLDAILRGVDPQEETLQKPGDRWGATNSINSQIRSEERWWERNKALIQYSDEGRSTSEIATLVSLSERQVREIRAKLNGLRAAQERPPRMRDYCMSTN